MRDGVRHPPVVMEQSLFAALDTPEVDLERTGGLDVRVDTTFATSERFALDGTSWVDHVHGWLTGDAPLIDLLTSTVAWEQRRRWMFTRTVEEPRLTAEYPSIGRCPHPVVRHLAAELGTHYGVVFERLWMNWYRDNDDGTGWHADRPADQLPEAVIPVLSLGATRRFLLRPKSGGGSVPFVVHSGDLVVMGGRCQRDWVHMVPKQRQVAGKRISLNFSARSVEEKRSAGG